MAEGAERVAKFLNQLYVPFAELFDPATCDDPEEQFRVSRLFGRHLRNVESEDLEGLAAILEGQAAPAAEASGEAAQAADETSGSDDEPSAR